MPIYEFVCKSCSKRFEVLVRASTTVTCPSCKSASLEKQLSVFAQGRPVYARGRVGDLTTSPVEGDPSMACGACGDPRGPGACSMD